jgi:hypothetical protein
MLPRRNWPIHAHSVRPEIAISPRRMPVSLARERGDPPSQGTILAHVAQRCDHAVAEQPSARAASSSRRLVVVTALGLLRISAPALHRDGIAGATPARH